MALSATVLGASGFTGGELVRKLLGHPALGLVSLGRSHAGPPIEEVLPHLTGGEPPPMVGIEAAAEVDADVCFSCLPSGALPRVMERIAAPVVIDLADDFRGGAWTYGLTEFARAEVTSSTRIANPGCYPTAALLCLVPFARAGAIAGPIVIDALSGMSGAGRGKTGYGFAELSASATAYGAIPHRHVDEMERGLARFGGLDAPISFTPHLVPMARGLLVTARASLEQDLSDATALQILNDAYVGEPFVEVVEGWPATKPLTGTNRVHVSARVDSRTGFLIASAALDNLGKGAAGQAIQNANLALGMDENAGLSELGIWP